MQFVVPGCKEDPPLRAAGKMVHLTFAALYDGELTLEGVLNHARRWATTRHGLREYTIGLEEHSHPADPQRRKHIHAYLKFGKKIDITDRHHTKVFDLLGRHGRVLHPELQAVGSMPSDRERVINYDMKDGEYIGELETPLVHDKRRAAAEESGSDEDEADEDEEKDMVPKGARMLNKASNVREGMLLLADMAPHVYYQRLGRRDQADARRARRHATVQALLA